jgi:hypothetical protein
MRNNESYMIIKTSTVVKTEYENEGESLKESKIQENLSKRGTTPRGSRVDIPKMKAVGAKYEGNWLDHMKHGKGKWTWSDGSSYEGDFLEDKI